MFDFLQYNGFNQKTHHNDYAHSVVVREQLLKITSTDTLALLAQRIGC